MKITPRKKQILIKPDGEESSVSKYGISAPSNDDKEQRATGTVIDVGSEVSKDIEKGRRVIFGTFAGDEIKIKENDKDVEYKLIFDEEILAFLE